MIDNYELVFGLTNLLIYLPICYFSYRIVENLSEESDVASAMFFLKKDTERTFRYASLLVATVAVGEIFLFTHHFYGGFFKALGYLTLTVPSIGVLYFVRKLSKVTETPSDSN